MSRQILSYADLGPIKTVTTSLDSIITSGNSRDDSPLRKRKRTEDDIGEVSIHVGSNQASVSQPTQHTHAKNQSNKQGQRYQKKYQARAGPSSAQRLHWDSQPSEEVGLAYVEEKERRSPVASTQRQTHHLNSRNGPTGANTKGYSSNPLASSSKPTNSEQGKVQARETPRVKVGDVLPMGQDDWDDSLLIDAWNAAEQEYMEMHGGTKWKMAPVKFSSLWHSAPIAEKSGDNVDADDSQVSDADHPGEVAMDDYQAPAKSYPDPDLAPEIPTNLALHTGQTDLELGSISLEEAFHKAKEASYALGYWTAVYQMKANEKSAAQHDLAVGAEESDNAEDDAEEFAPTQR